MFFVTLRTKAGGVILTPPANSKTKEATMKLCTVIAYYNTSTTKQLKFLNTLFYCLWLLFCFVLEGENYSKKMIKFSSSFKLTEINRVDSSFNEDPKNIIFFHGSPNFEEGTAGKFRGNGQ